jgi:serine/threonine protein kinase
MIDFGYSCLGLTEDDTVMLPISWPWHAPELTFTVECKLRDAKKTDVFSFGMVCLYMLFWNHFSEDSADSTKGGSVSRLHQWKISQEGILSKLDKLLRETAGPSDELKQSLRAFFRSTLSDDRDSRNTDLNTLMAYLSYVSVQPSLGS